MLAALCSHGFVASGVLQWLPVLHPCSRQQYADAECVTGRVVLIDLLNIFPDKLLRC